VCVLDPSGLEESQICGLSKKYKFYLRNGGNVAIGISEEDWE